MLKQTKIVASISDLRCEVDFIRDLYNAGMNVVRMNTAHANREGFEKLIANVREVSNRIAILMDTKGPEVRTTASAEGPIDYKIGDKVKIVGKPDQETTRECIAVTYPGFVQDLSVGASVLIDDGELALEVKEKDADTLYCEVTNDATLGSRKSVNVPGVRINLPSLTEKDRNNILYAIEKDIDYIAHSFVRNKQDVLDIRQILDEHNSGIRIIAKIENSEGVENMDDILKVADGIMVARGDLGVEVPAEDVPLIQKSIIKKCKQRGKIVITATQMLESMQQNPRPTRAEVSDVANAIYDGTDAIMLSGESASGLYPQEAVMMMSKIALKTEGTLDYQSLQRQAIRTAPDDTSEAICMSVAEIAYKFNVAAIIAFTESGFTARKMARYRTKSRIIAATPSIKTVKALALNWGVKAVPCKPLNSRISMIDYASIIARENGVKPGQKILVTGGTPGVKGATSYLELVEVK